MNSEEVMNNLSDRTINIGILHSYMERKNIKTEKITTDRLILVTSLPFLKNRITANELKMLPLIFREEGSGTRATVQQHLKPHHIKISDLNII